jgi:hypothetical protein
LHTQTTLGTKNKFSGFSGAGMVVKVDGLWKLAGMISSCGHMPVVKKKSIMVSICDLNNYLVYTDVSKFNSWIERVIIDSYNSTLDDDVVYKVNEVSAGRSVLGNTFQLKLFYFLFFSVFFI